MTLPGPCPCGTVVSATTDTMLLASSFTAAHCLTAHGVTVVTQPHGPRDDVERAYSTSSRISHASAGTVVDRFDTYRPLTLRSTPSNRLPTLSSQLSRVVILSVASNPATSTRNLRRAMREERLDALVCHLQWNRNRDRQGPQAGRVPVLPGHRLQLISRSPRRPHRRSTAPAQAIPTRDPWPIGHSARNAPPEDRGHWRQAPSPARRPGGNRRDQRAARSARP